MGTDAKREARLRKRKLFWFFWVVSLLPAFSAVVADWYAWHIVLQGYHLPWRYWLLLEGVAVGVAVPRLGARVAGVIVLVCLVVLGMWSIGLFYIPTLALAVAATLVQMESDGKWSA